MTTMKRIYENISMVLLGTMALLGGTTLLSSCSDNISGDSYYTFTEQTVASYCEENPEQFSVFYQLMKDAGEEPLLSSYGHYTAFIPTDSAFQAYFKENNLSMESLTKEQKDTIIYNHVIRSVTQDYLTKDFNEGAISTTNMNNRFMVISYQKDAEGNNEIWVNKSSRIISADNKVHNGVIHAINKVLVPSKDNLGTQLAEQKDFKLFSEAFQLTHLEDSIKEAYDLSYKSPYTTEYVNVVGYSVKGLAQKKLGYTIFAEPDDVFRANSINNIEDLVSYAERYYGTEDKGNYTSRNNALNKFISYHMLDRQMSTNSFIYSGANTATTAMDKRYEYYETMLKDRVMEIKAGNKINTLKDGSCVTLDASRSNISGLNGYIHCLNQILVYDENNMRNDVLNKRIRIDAYALMPELTNNNVRWQLINGISYTMPPAYCGNHLKFNDDTKLIMWGSEAWDDHQADEMSFRGWYDFTLRTIPVPPGTYEIRIGYNKTDWRGIAQLFVDGKIAGIPVNLRIDGLDPKIGWVKDSETTDGGIENDKMLRNRGYMKAPNSIINSGYKTNLRDAKNDLRIIVGQYTWQDYAPHFIRAKNVEAADREFQLDFIELVPVSYIENEGID